MIYYNSRDISFKLEINIAKWKRWSRDFLPPDPLGGLQSGVARQFNLRDVFKTFFGGYLVGELKFTIPEAIQILSDLSPWLKKNGFYELQPKINPFQDGKDRSTYIYIHSAENRQFTYCARTILGGIQSNPEGNYQQIFTQTLIGTASDPFAAGQSLSATVIAINTLYDDMLRRIG